MAGKHQLRADDVTVAGKRPDPEVTACLLDVVEVGNAVDVDDGRGVGEAQFHEGDQAHPPGQHLGLLAVVRHHLAGFLEGSGGFVVKAGGIHRASCLS